MAIIQWTEELSVNVAEIDKEHKKLIGIINTLYDSMNEGKSRHIMEDILNDLTSYAISHFNTEEMYFEQFNFPGAEAHEKEHGEFILKVGDFTSNFKKGVSPIDEDILNFLIDWLVLHIQGTDKKYSSFFNENGLI